VNPVPDSYLTASSELGVPIATYEARMDTISLGWCASFSEWEGGIPPTMYLQVGKVNLIKLVCIGVYFLIYLALII